MIQKLNLSFQVRRERWGWTNICQSRYILSRCYVCERDSQWHKWGGNIQNRKLIEIKLTHSLSPPAPVDKQGDYGNIDFPTTYVRNNTTQHTHLASRKINLRSMLALNMNMFWCSFISVIADGGSECPTATSPRFWMNAGPGPSPV